MASDKKYSLILNFKSDVAGIEEANKQFKALEKEAGAVGTAVAKVYEQFDYGTGKVKQAVTVQANSLKELVKFKEAIEKKLLSGTITGEIKDYVGKVTGTNASGYSELFQSQVAFQEKRLQLLKKYDKEELNDVLATLELREEAERSFQARLVQIQAQKLPGNIQERLLSGAFNAHTKSLQDIAELQAAIPTKIVKENAARELEKAEAARRAREIASINAHADNIREAEEYANKQRQKTLRNDIIERARLQEEATREEEKARQNGLQLRQTWNKAVARQEEVQAREAERAALNFAKGIARSDNIVDNLKQHLHKQELLRQAANAKEKEAQLKAEQVGFAAQVEAQRKLMETKATQGALNKVSPAQGAIFRVKQEIANARAELEGQAKTLSRLVAHGTLSGQEALERYKVTLTEATPKIEALITKEKQLQTTLTNSGRHWDSLIEHIFKVYVAWNAANLSIGKTFEGVHSIIPVGIALDSVRASLESTVGSSAAAESIIKALGVEAQRTGLHIGALRTNFATLQASTSLAGVSLEDTWKIFQNINTVSVALHKTTDETNGIFLALAQIFNKSKVQSEELVKQLGNLLPGAFAAFAASYRHMEDGIEKVGISTQLLSKKLQEGVVYAQDTILDFTEFMRKRFAGSFVIASEMLNAEIGRMWSSFTRIGEALYATTNGPIKATVHGITELNESIIKFIEDEKAFTTALYAVKDALIAVTISGVVYYAAKLGEASRAAGGLKAAQAFLTTPTAIVAGISEITFALTDYIHAAYDATEATFKFIQELEKKKLAETGTYEQKLQLEIDNDATVKSIDHSFKQLASEIEGMQSRKDLVNRLALGLSAVSPVAGAAVAGTANRSFLPTDVVKDINDSFEILKQFDPTIEKISKAEETVGVSLEKAVKLREAALKYLKQEGELARTNAKDKATARMEEERQNKVKAIVGDRPTDKDIMPSDLLEAEAHKTYDVAIADARRLNDERKASVLLLQQEELLVKAKNAKLDETYKARIAEEDRRLAAINKAIDLAAKEKKAVDPEILAAKADAEAQKSKLELLKQGEKAKLDAETTTKLAELKKKTYAEEKKEREVQYKDAERDARNLAESLEVSLTNLDANFKAGTLSIARYVEEWRKLQREKNEKLGQAYEENANIAFAAGDQAKFAEYQDKLQALATEGRKADAEAAKKKQELLEDYNKQLQEVHAEYLRDIGQEEEAESLAYATKMRHLRALTAAQANEGDPAAIAALKEIAHHEAIVGDKVKFAKLEKQVEQEKLGLKDTEYNLELKLKSGAIDQLIFQKQLFDEKQRYIAVIEDILSKEKELNLTEAQKTALLRQQVDLQRENRDKIGSAKSYLQSSIGSSSASFLLEGGNNLQNFEQENKQAYKYTESEDFAKSAAKQGLELHQAQLDYRLEADKKYAASSAAVYLDMGKGITNIGAEIAQQHVENTIRMYGANSAQARKAFAQYKAMKIAEATIDVAKAVVASLSMGLPVGAVMAAVAGAMGAVEIAKIASQQMPAAHGGLEVSQSEQTYKLVQGERVISPKQNVGLMRMVNSYNTAQAANQIGTGQKPKVNVIIVRSEEETLEHINSAAGEQAIMTIVRRNQG